MFCCSYFYSSQIFIYNFKYQFDNKYVENYCLAYKCDEDVGWKIVAHACVCKDDKTRQIEFKKAEDKLKEYDDKFKQELKR